MEHWRIKVEPEEQVDTTQNAVKMKAEPEDGDPITSCIDIEEHPVKLEEEQNDALICGLPAPDTETADQEQPRDIDDNKSPSLNQALQFNCAHCVKCFDSKIKRYHHIRTVHAQKKHSCDDCGKCFVDKTALKRHSFTHSSVPQFECTECYKKYRFERSLLEHKTIIHRHIKFKCDLCSKLFTYKSNLSRHTKFVHNIGEIVRLKCDLCQRTYKRRNNLIQHWQKIHLNPKKVTCDICNKTYKNRDSLRGHKQRVHCDTAGLRCNICNKLYKNKNYLSSHKRLAHKENSNKIPTSMPGDAMEHWRIKVEPEEQVEVTENAVKMKAEPEDGDLITSCIDIEEHPVKLEEEQSDALICGLPAPDIEISDQEQPQDIDSNICAW